MRLSKEAIEALGLSNMFRERREAREKAERVRFYTVIRLINLFAQFNGDDMLQIISERDYEKGINN